MRSRTTRRFRALYAALPRRVQEQADKAFQLFKTDPDHPSLEFGKVGKVWRAKFGDGYRVIAFKNDEGDLIWIFIGTHADYDKLRKS